MSSLKRSKVGKETSYLCTPYKRACKRWFCLKIFFKTSLLKLETYFEHSIASNKAHNLLPHVPLNHLWILKMIILSYLQSKWPVALRRTKRTIAWEGNALLNIPQNSMKKFMDSTPTHCASKPSETLSFLTKIHQVTLFQYPRESLCTLNQKGTTDILEGQE